MDRTELIEGLKYITDGPRREHGGFHSRTVEIAQAAIDALNTAADQSLVIEVLTERIERLRAIMGKVMKRSEEMYTVLKLGDALRDDTKALAEAQRIQEGK